MTTSPSEASFRVLEKKYSSYQHCKDLNSSLNTLRQHQQLCDVGLIVEGKEFSAHRAVLAGASSYFQNLFTIDMKEKREEKVEIGELKCAVMEDLLEFIYTGDVLLTKSNAVELLKAANYTNVCHLERLCEEFLEETLSLENCISMHHLAETYNCQELKKVSRDFIKKHFSKVLEFPEFLEMAETEVEFFLRSDDIVVKEEEEVYEGLVKWAKHEPEARRNQFGKLFSFVRLGQLPKQFIFSVVAEEDLISSDPSCLKLALKASTSSSDECESTQGPRDCLNNFAKVIVICGGLDSDFCEQRDNIFFVPSSNIWCKLADLEENQVLHCSVELEGFMYVLGGKQLLENCDSSISDVVSRYEFRTNSWTWSSVAPMQRAVSVATAVTLKGQIYVIGGGNKTETLNIVQKYNPDTNIWELVKPLTVNRIGACSVSDGLNIYAIGGVIKTVIAGTENNEDPEYEREYLDSCEKYDQRSDSWVMVAPMKAKRASAAAAVLRQQIFVVGGYNDEFEAIASCEVYNIPLDCWSTIASLQVSRCFPGASVIAGKIYIIAGEDEYMNGVQAVECYDPSKGEDGWQVVSRMPGGKTRGSVCSMRLAKLFIEGCETL